MGQRLVISVQRNNKDIAKIHYHWSTYTYSALERTKELLEAFLGNDFINIEDEILRLIRIVESFDGCILKGKGSDEFNRIQSIYPNEIFKEDGDRNVGLIAITEEGMEDIQAWSEGDVTVDLDSKTIINEVFFWYDSKEDIEDDEDFEYEDVDFDIGVIKFDELNDIIEKLDNTSSYVLHSLITNDWYELIE